MCGFYSSQVRSSILSEDDEAIINCMSIDGLMLVVEKLVVGVRRMLMSILTILITRTKTIHILVMLLLIH